MYVLSHLRDTVLMQSVEGMKVVCHDLAQTTSDPKSSAMVDAVCAVLMH